MQCYLAAKGEMWAKVGPHLLLGPPLRGDQLLLAAARPSSVAAGGISCSISATAIIHSNVNVSGVINIRVNVSNNNNATIINSNNSGVVIINKINSSRNGVTIIKSNIGVNISCNNTTINNIIVGVNIITGVIININGAAKADVTTPRVQVYLQLQVGWGHL